MKIDKHKQKIEKEIIIPEDYSAGFQGVDGELWRGSHVPRVSVSNEEQMSLQPENSTLMRCCKGIAIIFRRKKRANSFFFFAFKKKFGNEV